MVEHFVGGAALLDIAVGNIQERGTPDEVFNHPQNPRLQEFLSKVL